MILKIWSMHFGGEAGVTTERSDAWHGNVWHTPKSLVEWGFEISKFLISLWQLSKDGVFCLNLNL